MRDGSLDYYKQLYNEIEFRPERIPQIMLEAQRILNGYDQYRYVWDMTNVPWYFHGFVHEMEANCNFALQILNGESWKRRTTLVPVGRGPWGSWAESAVYALNRKRAEDKTWKSLLGWDDWSIPVVAREWERWNGGGYMKRGKHSPYLVAGSYQDEGTGYYTSDHGYDPNAKSKQIGALVLMKYMHRKLKVAA